MKIQKALQQEALENGLLRLERLNSEKESAEEAAAEKNSAYYRARTEFDNSDFDGKIRSLQGEIDDLTQKLKRAETEISRIEQLQTYVDKLPRRPGAEPAREFRYPQTVGAGSRFRGKVQRCAGVEKNGK